MAGVAEDEPPPFTHENFPSMQVGSANYTTDQRAWVRISNVEIGKALNFDDNKITNEIGRIIGPGNVAGLFEYEGKSNLVVPIKNEKFAKLLIDQTTILGVKVTVKIHPTRNITRGVFTDPSYINKSEDELLQMLAPQGVIAVRRVKKRDNQNENTATVFLSFRGKDCPTTLKIGNFLKNIRPFQVRPLQCYCCFGFGHSKARCPTKIQKCGNCSKPVNEHSEEERQNGKCIRASECSACNSKEHSLASQECPKYKKEIEILRYMQTYDLSFVEARNRVEKRQKQLLNYSQAVATPSAQDAALVNLTKQVNSLVELFTKMQPTNTNPANTTNDRLTALERAFESQGAELQEIKQKNMELIRANLQQEEEIRILKGELNKEKEKTQKIVNEKEALTEYFREATIASKKYNFTLPEVPREFQSMTPHLSRSLQNLSDWTGQSGPTEKRTLSTHSSTQSLTGSQTNIAGNKRSSSRSLRGSNSDINKGTGHEPMDYQPGSSKRTSKKGGDSPPPKIPPKPRRNSPGDPKT